jgi:hypothetical protein
VPLQQVKVRNQPVGRKGLQRKSFLPLGGKKIAAESPVFGPWGLRSNPQGPKRRTSFSQLVAVGGFPLPGNTEEIAFPYFSAMRLSRAVFLPLDIFLAP